jgi:hypothetical protein
MSVILVRAMALARARPSGRGDPESLTTRLTGQMGWPGGS